MFIFSLGMRSKPTRLYLFIITSIVYAIHLIMLRALCTACQNYMVLHDLDLPAKQVLISDNQA